MTAAWVGRVEFEDLLASLFDDAELRRWLAVNPDVSEISDLLPGPSVGLRELVHSTTDVLSRRGLIETRLFEHLIRDFPARQTDIRRVLQTWIAHKKLYTGGFAAHQALESADPAMQAIADELERTCELRELAVLAGEDTTLLDEKRLALRRTLRRGPQLKPHDVLLHDRYRLGESIGSGGFATVWRAYDRETKAVVAVKVLHSERSVDPTLRERFARGARNTARMSHPNIIRIHREMFEDGGFYAYVMEFLSGGDLKTRILKQGMDEREILTLFVRLCDALQHAHQLGFIHRDVTPSNIVLDAHGSPRLTDFDMMKALDTTGGTAVGAGMGTFIYSAPEVMNDASAADARSDIYSLGMTLLFCLMRRELTFDVFVRPAVYLSNLKCGRPLKNLIARAIAHDPADRPSSALMMGQLLRELASPTPNQAILAFLTPASEREHFRDNLPRYLSEEPWSPDTYRASDPGKIIVIAQGDLCTYEVEAIVCGTDRSGGAGHLGFRIARSGGPELGEHTEGNRRLIPGEVIVAPGGNLPCKHVLYVVQDQSPLSLTVRLSNQISLIINRALMVADSRRITRIAFPLLFTGSMGISRTEILTLMFDALFDLLPLAERVREANIVLYPLRGPVAISETSDRSPS